MLFSWDIFIIFLIFARKPKTPPALPSSYVSDYVKRWFFRYRVRRLRYDYAVCVTVWVKLTANLNTRKLFHPQLLAGTAPISILKSFSLDFPFFRRIQRGRLNCGWINLVNASVVWPLPHKTDTRINAAMTYWQWQMYQLRFSWSMKIVVFHWLCNENLHSQRTTETTAILHQTCWCSSD